MRPLFAALGVFIVALSSSGAAERPAPRLVAAETDGARRLWVEVDSGGSTVRRLTGIPSTRRVVCSPVLVCRTSSELRNR